MIVGHTDGGNIIASDVSGSFKVYTGYFIENEEIVCMQDDCMEIFNVDQEPIEKTSTHIDWDVDAAEKGGYEHFMLKEMYEQPKAILDTFSPRIKGDKIEIEELNMTDEEIRNIRKIMIVACGSAYHAGVTAKYVFEGMARIPVEVDVASQFRYRNPILEKDTFGYCCDQSIRRNGRFASCFAGIKEPGSKSIRNCKCNWKFYCTGSGLCHVYVGRSGDCCGNYKSIFLSADCAGSFGNEICICKRGNLFFRTAGIY